MAPGLQQSNIEESKEGDSLTPYRNETYNKSEEVFEGSSVELLGDNL